MQASTLQSKYLLFLDGQLEQRRSLVRFRLGNNSSIIVYNHCSLHLVASVVVGRVNRTRSLTRRKVCFALSSLYIISFTYFDFIHIFIVVPLVVVVVVATWFLPCTTDSQRKKEKKRKLTVDDVGWNCMEDLFWSRHSTS